MDDNQDIEIQDNDRDFLILSKLQSDFVKFISGIAATNPVAAKLYEYYPSNEEMFDDMVFNFWMDSGEPEMDLPELGMRHTKEYQTFFSEFLIWVEGNVDFENNEES